MKSLTLQKTFILTIIFSFLATIGFAQTSTNSMDNYKGKVFIFDANGVVYSCNAVGDSVNNTPIIVYLGSRFIVVKNNNGDLVITFLVWKLPKPTDTVKYNAAINNRKKYNFYSKANEKNAPLTISNQNDNVRYFLLKSSDRSNSFSEYEGSKFIEITEGTLYTPFKFRPTKSYFTSNFALGTSLLVQHKFRPNWAYGGILGLSLTSVTLDDFSTNEKVTTSTNRPAITPSFSGLISYKNIGVTLGFGMDYINRTTPEEKSWIFNGKPWIGFGIGISLFRSEEAPATKPIN